MLIMGLWMMSDGLNNRVIW